MEEPSEEDVVEMNPPAESDEPILVTAVDHCLLCGQIAVLYDLGGNVMKREMANSGAEVTYQDLFDYLCQSLGLRKNSRIKKDWNFYTGPFPFCVECEQFLHVLAAIYKQMDQLNKDIKWKMSEAENTFVNEQLYQKQDYRYLNFRKQALGDLFRGSIGVASQNRRRSQRQSRIKIESISSIADVKKEDHPQVLQEGPNQEPSLLEQPQKVEGSETNITSMPLRRSLRVRDKQIRNLEISSSGESFAVAEVYTENYDTGTATNPVIVKDENCSEVEVAKVSARKSTRLLRKRKRQSEAVNDLKSEDTDIKEEDAEIENTVMDKDDFNWSQNGNPSQSKRGRKKKGLGNNEAVVASATSVNIFGLKREYAERKIKIELGLQWNAHSDDDSLSLGNTDLYMRAPWVKDPLSGNIYYRTIQFVWIKEENAFQCSTCSVFISYFDGCSDSKLKEKFHNHYIRGHSDRFKCRLCPEWTLFQNDLELHQHFRKFHPGHLHYEPTIQSHRKLVCPTIPNVPRKFKHFQRKPCTICLKPLNAQDEKEVEEHRLSHMNTEEKAIYLKSEATFKTSRKSRTTKIKGQFTTFETSSNCSAASQKERLEVKVESETRVRKRRGSYRKTLERNVKEETLPGDWNMCANCGQLVGNGDKGMKTHILTHQQTKSSLLISSYMCPDCGWETRSEKCLEVHMKRHQYENERLNPVTCLYPKCDKSFSKGMDLKSHLITKHESENEFMCKSCGRVFPTLRSLNKHSFEHFREKNEEPGSSNTGRITQEKSRNSKPANENSVFRRRSQRKCSEMATQRLEATFSSSPMKLE